MRNYLIVAVLLLVAVLGLSACSGQKQDITSLNEAASGESRGLSQQSGVINIFDLRTGHCFRDFEIVGDTEEFQEIELFSCNDRRAKWTVSRSVFIEQDGSYPGQTLLDDLFIQDCSTLYSRYFFPTPASWDLGDRTISCLRMLD